MSLWCKIASHPHRGQHDRLLLRWTKHFGGLREDQDQHFCTQLSVKMLQVRLDEDRGRYSCLWQQGWTERPLKVPFKGPFQPQISHNLMIHQWSNEGCPVPDQLQGGRGIQGFQGLMEHGAVPFRPDTTHIPGMVCEAWLWFCTSKEDKNNPACQGKMSTCNSPSPGMCWKFSF